MQIWSQLFVSAGQRDCTGETGLWAFGLATVACALKRDPLGAYTAYTADTRRSDPS